MPHPADELTTFLLHHGASIRDLVSLWAQIIYLVQTSQLLVKMKRTELRVKARRRAQAAQQHNSQSSLNEAGDQAEDKKGR